jgi:hypothetical protein
LLVLSFALPCAAPEPPPEPSPADRSPLAQQYLAKRIDLWQQRLQLQDWKISVIPSHRSELRAGTVGNIHWDADSKTARIRILDASEYRTQFYATLQDMEFTMVHELIHLELASLPRTDASRRDEEAAVDRMAGALLRLDRPDIQPN